MERPDKLPAPLPAPLPAAPPVGVRTLRWAAVAALLLVAGALYALAQTPAGEPAAAPLRLEIAEDATRFVFAEQPRYDDGLPAHGNPFVTQGYIYPEGTLQGGDGVLPDGSPEYPEAVIGEWTCRGWFVGDAAHAEEGVWVITTQLFELGDAPGEASLVTEGVELAAVGMAARRAISGGTGPYALAAGDSSQTLLGFNASEGVNLLVELRPAGP